jgi:hypothetical protein
MCGLLGRRHREHEPVGSEKLYSFIAGGFSCKAQLNASDLERETMMLIYGSSRRQGSITYVPDCSGRNSEQLEQYPWSGQI